MPIAKLISNWVLSMQAWVQLHGSQCGIYGELSSHVVGFSPSTLVPL
jgi:hypothetical protein